MHKVTCHLGNSGAGLCDHLSKIIAVLVQLLLIFISYFPAFVSNCDNGAGHQTNSQVYFELGSLQLWSKYRTISF